MNEVVVRFFMFLRLLKKSDAYQQILSVDDQQELARMLTKECVNAGANVIHAT
jgi:hypothetical protein